MPPPFINPEEDERVEETLTDPKHGEYTIKVPPPLVQKAKPPSQRNFVIHQRDPRYPHIPYPSRMNQEKQKEKDEVQIYKFWQMFKQLHINISLVDALILIPKYQKMLESLISNKEKLIELANTPLNEKLLSGSSDFLPFPECDSVFYEDFSEVDALSSTNNEDKVFNPGILIHENLFDVTNCATPEKNVKKTTNASLIHEDFNPPLYELPFHKEVPGLRALLSFSSENEEKVFNPGILTSKRVHTSLLPELSHRGPKAFKVIKILESPMEIFPCSYGEDIRVLDVSCLHFYPP
ncbi:hypothetical protein Tco_1292009 [Tanacetum coccineum]